MFHHTYDLVNKIIERKIFMGANTPDGFVGFYNQIVDNYCLEKIYILKGGNGVGKSTFIKKFTEHFVAQAKEKNNQLTVDYLMCSADPSSYDGAILHELGLAIVDGTHPHIVEPKYSGLVEQIIDLGAYIEPKKIKADRIQLKQMMDKRSEHFRNAFEQLKRARETHLMVEQMITPAMDFVGVNKLLVQLLKRHFS